MAVNKKLRDTPLLTAQLLLPAGLRSQKFSRSYLIVPGNTTLFSSSAPSSDEETNNAVDEGEDTTTKPEQAWKTEPERKTSTAVFRWDGTRIVPETEAEGAADVAKNSPAGVATKSPSKVTAAPKPPPRSTSAQINDTGHEEDQEASSDGEENEDSYNDDNDADYEETATEDDALDDHEDEDEVGHDRQRVGDTSRPKAAPRKVSS